MSGDEVLFKAPVSKESVQRAISDDWNPLDKQYGREVFKSRIGAKHGNTVGAAISRDHLPEAHTILNSLLVDPAALFNTFRLFGGCFVRAQTGETNDMATISAMLHAATEYLDRMKDNQRCHVDTAALAKLFRPLVPSMLAIIDEANGSAA